MKTLKEATRINFLNQQRNRAVKREEREVEEYHRLQRVGKCTCHLLVPLGHVSCIECNGWTIPGEDSVWEELGLTL